MLKDLILKNRSYRGYDESYHFTKEEMMELVEHARLSASSLNAQPLRYFIAWQKEVVDAIQVHTGWAKALPQLELPHKGMCPTGFIVICLDKNVEYAPSTFTRDVGIAAQSMLLAAAEKDLGGCMIGSFSAAGIKEACGLSEDLQPMLVVAVGKPAEKIVLVEVEEGESLKYYRDEQDVHYVPKKKLEDIVLYK